jgi:glycosyltransferase involved in cell wall biosynthesis
MESRSAFPDDALRVALIPTPALQSDWGSVIHAILLADRLATVGIEVHVYCLNHPDLPRSTAIFHDLPLPLVHPVLMDPLLSDAQFMSCMRTLAEALIADHAKAPFDVVHAHYTTVTGLAGLMVQTFCGLPLVVSSFGRDLNVGAAQAPRYRRMVELTVSHARAVIASDSAVARQLTECYGVTADRVFTVPMGVDDHLFSPSVFRPALRVELLKGADHLVINVSSCFEPEKGIDVLLRAARRLIDNGLRLSVIIIGEDDYDDLRQERQLRQLTADLDLERAVTFLGRLAHRDIPAYLAAADVIVDPRTMGNFSSVTLEALFTGAFVVASDVPGNRLLLGDGWHGVLHRAGDASDLAAQTARALTDAPLRADITASVAGWRSESGAHFTADHMRDRTIDIYRRVIADERKIAEARSLAT